jgi:hypothetical protein
MKYSGTSTRFLAIALAAMSFAACSSGGGEPAQNNEPPAAGDSPPAIWGDPDTSVTVGSQYVFAPEAEDADGDVLSFEIANKPSWSDFDDASGVLQGVPADSATGTYSDIVVSVSDGTSVVSLPNFSITVDPAGSGGGGGGGGPSSSPPTISGQPNSSVVVNTQYVFQPQASDPDGDPLSFSIVNKPSWSNFNSQTGRLSGTPGGADTGTTSGIELSVTDGDFVDSLNAFSITVDPAAMGSKLISWQPPILNNDGSLLNDLAGYRLFYGTVSGEYNQTVQVNSPGTTSHLLENLAAGTYFLVMVSYNSVNVESVYSGELSFEIGN